MPIVVDPNPAPEGGRVTITVDGSGPYYMRTGGSGDAWQEVATDPETNRATVDVVGSPPQTLDISNRDLGAPDSTVVPIESRD